MTDVERQVQPAYQGLMEGFRTGDDERYFSSFHPDASFLFPDQSRLDGSDAYREVWDGWKRDHGFEVLDAASRDVVVQGFGSTAILTHAVETRQRWDGEEQTLHQRETIVFELQPDGTWLAVHEHLSDAAP